MSDLQYLRKATLVISSGGTTGNNISAYTAVDALDLSEFHFTFSTKQQDVESPNNCSIRVYNLSRDTVETILKREYAKVTVQAGYQSAFGVIFTGNIKQYRIGRENATTTYLDILAADGDEAYNYAVVKQTLAAASTPADRLNAAIAAMNPNGVTAGTIAPATGGVLPRGKVLFGMARAIMRQETQNMGMTWNINNGKVNVVPLTGYRPGEAVRLSSLTGLIGIPEQSENGLQVRCLLNPRIAVGGLVQIDNKSVNQTVQQSPSAAPIAYNSYVGIQLLARVTNDGLYRVYVAEHQGDTRGQLWYTDLVCLALDPSTNTVLVK